MISKGIISVLLLILSNVFMTFAWYGHLYLKKVSALQAWGITGIILFSWFLALFEYIFQVPANKIGFDGNQGPFNLFELKIIQEVISLIVFTIMAILIFKTDTLRWNHLAAFALILVAVYLVFKK